MCIPSHAEPKGDEREIEVVSELQIPRFARGDKSEGDEGEDVNRTKPRPTFPAVVGLQPAPIASPCDNGRRMISTRRVLGLDVGSKRIGVAVSDPLGITAQGLETIQRQNKRRDLETLEGLLKQYDVREIVVGLPLRLSGAEGTQSEKMRQFARDLESHFGVTVHLWDERWTSTEANRLLREAELSIEKRGKAVDRMAAVLILQSWMEAHPL